MHKGRAGGGHPGDQLNGRAGRQQELQISYVRKRQEMLGLSDVGVS